jgi:hypothetical protein
VEHLQCKICRLPAALEEARVEHHMHMLARRRPVKVTAAPSDLRAITGQRSVIGDPWSRTARVREILCAHLTIPASRPLGECHGRARRVRSRTAAADPREPSAAAGSVQVSTGL